MKRLLLALALACAPLSAHAQVSSLNAQTGSIPSGVAFPGTPGDNDHFIRTDRDIEYYYDGTRWLSAKLHSFTWSLNAAAISADTTVYTNVPYQGVYSLWLVRFEGVMFRSAAGEWDLLFQSITAANVTSVVLTLDGNGDTSANWVNHGTDIGAVLDTNARALAVTQDEISGTATLLSGATVWYRLIG